MKLKVFPAVTQKIKSFFAPRQTFELNELLKFLGVDQNYSKRALNEATYYACMKILSESIGKMPLKLLRYSDDNGVETERKHSMFYLVHDRPNPYMTASTFWSTVEFNRNHYGNAYVWIRGAGSKTALWILPTTEVRVIYDDALVLAEQPDVYYQYSHGGKQWLFKSEEILHFKTFCTLDGLVGVPVREQLAETLSGASDSQKMLNKMYKSGFTAKAVLNYTGSLNDANVEELVKLTESYAKGEMANNGIENIIPMPLGFSLNALNVKLADNQFVEVKKYTALQIASAFGIKPNQIGDYDKSSYASAQAQQLSFYVDTLLYIVKQYEEELTYKLLTDTEAKNGYRFKFNIASILRADLETQIKTLSQGVSNFIYTPNEARAMLDLQAKPGGDRLLGNGASIPVDLAGIQYQRGGESSE